MRYTAVFCCGWKFSVSCRLKYNLFCFLFVFFFWFFCGFFVFCFCFVFWVFFFIILLNFRRRGMIQCSGFFEEWGFSYREFCYVFFLSWFYLFLLTFQWQDQRFFINMHAGLLNNVKATLSSVSHFSFPDFIQNCAKLMHYHSNSTMILGSEGVYSPVDDI